MNGSDQVNKKNKVSRGQQHINATLKSYSSTGTVTSKPGPRQSRPQSDPRQSFPAQNARSKQFKSFLAAGWLVGWLTELTICISGAATSLSIVRCVPSLENWKVNL